MKFSAAFVVILIFVALTGCHNQPGSAYLPEQPIAARVVRVSATDTAQPIVISGVIKPRLEADLSAQILAPVTTVSKHEGDHFHRGEVLVRLHAPALDAGVAQATAAVNSAEQQATAAETQAGLAANNLARYAQLRERHSVTPYELDQIRATSAAAQAQQQSANAQVTAARATLNMQRANAADTVLTAPFDGVVTRRMVDPGAMAAPGIPLLHLQSTDAKDVEFSVSDSSLRDLKVGSLVPVTPPNEPGVTARIIDIAPAGDPQSHSFLIKARLPSETGWDVGTVVQVSLPAPQGPPGISIPSSALVQQGGLDAVLVVSPESRAAVRYVTIGRGTGNFTQILSGLKSGDRILATGDLALAGRQIEVRE